MKSFISSEQLGLEYIVLVRSADAIDRNDAWVESGTLGENASLPNRVAWHPSPVKFFSQLKVNTNYNPSYELAWQISVPARKF